MSYHRTQPRRRRAFTLIEVLIAVALTAALAVAAGAGFVAAARSAETGDDYLRASRTASRVLETIVTDVHNAMAVQLLSTTSMQLARADGSVVTYRYDATPRELHLVHNDGVTQRDNVLARDLSSVAFTAVVEPDPSTLVNRVVQVTVSMKPANANAASTAMTASANCRRKRTYQ